MYTARLESQRHNGMKLYILKDSEEWIIGIWAYSVIHSHTKKTNFIVVWLSCPKFHNREACFTVFQFWKTGHIYSNITIWFYIHNIPCISATSFIIRAGLVLRQGYIPEEHGADRTQNSHLKQCISWGLENWQLHTM